MKMKTMDKNYIDKNTDLSFISITKFGTLSPKSHEVWKTNQEYIKNKRLDFVNSQEKFENEQFNFFFGEKERNIIHYSYSNKLRDK